MELELALEVSEQGGFAQDGVDGVELCEPEGETLGEALLGLAWPLGGASLAAPASPVTGLLVLEGEVLLAPALPEIAPLWLD